MTESSAADDVDLARRALARGPDGLTATGEQVCRARIADPGATWELIAHRTGLGEEQAVAAFRAATGSAETEEDLADAASARAALAEPGEIPWEQVKAEAAGSAEPAPG